MARRPTLPGVDRRQQILEAALDIFAEEGFEGATTKEIAARADVTPGLIYFYFPSKEELFTTAFAYQAKEALAEIEFPDDPASDEPPELVIRRGIERLVEVLETPRSLSLIRIMLRVSAHNDLHAPCGRPAEEARSRIRAQGLQMAAAFQRYLEGQMERGRLRRLNAKVAAPLIMNALVMTVVRRASDQGELAVVPREQFIDALVQLFLHGLLPPDATGTTLPPGKARSKTRDAPDGHSVDQEAGVLAPAGER